MATAMPATILTALFATSIVLVQLQHPPARARGTWSLPALSPSPPFSPSTPFSYLSTFLRSFYHQAPIHASIHLADGPSSPSFCLCFSLLPSFPIINTAAAIYKSHFSPPLCHSMLHFSVLHLLIGLFIYPSPKLTHLLPTWRSFCHRCIRGGGEASEVRHPLHT